MKFMCSLVITVVFTSCGTQQRQQDGPEEESQTPAPIQLNISSPQGGASVASASSEGAGIFSVKGDALGVYGTEMTLMIFVSPEHPASDGWYPQGSPQGEPDLRPDGSWKAEAQLGSEEYPPIDGAIFDLAVLALTSEEVAEVDEQSPPFSTLPQVDANRVHVAEDVVFTK